MLHSKGNEDSNGRKSMQGLRAGNDNLMDRLVDARLGLWLNPDPRKLAGVHTQTLVIGEWTGAWQQSTYEISFGSIDLAAVHLQDSFW